MTDGLDQPQIEAVHAALAAHRARPGALLPVLHAVQSALGWVPPAAVPLIAHELNLSRAEVQGVLTFYHDFRRQPPARQHVRLCRAEACQAVGANALAAALQQRLGIGFGEQSRDGRVALDAVYCFGNCARGPTLELDGALYSAVALTDLDALLPGVAR
jgi:formate dehydrogenase subunit gamma